MSSANNPDCCRKEAGEKSWLPLQITSREPRRRAMRFETVNPKAMATRSRLWMQISLFLFYFDFAAFSSS